MQSTRLGILTTLGWVAMAACLQADSFTWIDDDQQTRTVEGSLVASGRGFHVVGQADSQYRIIPQEQLQQRVPGDDPVPISPEAMADALRGEFGEDRIRLMVDAPYVVGLVLAGPLPERSESKVDGFLRTANRFQHNVEAVFSKFCRELRLDTHRPESPLVLLVFETDRDFNTYARLVTGGEGLAAENMAGFYSPLSNWLAIRIGEFRSFKVPLHEAIHQQVYNRGLLQRLAGVPVWFNEGIATGFENNGERINIGPTKINAMYARMVPQATNLTWEEVHRDDSTFTGNVLAGEAYVHAWSMHWLLVSRHRREYTKYFQRLGQIEPLEQLSPEEREQLFQETFGVSVAKLETEFPRLLEAGMKRQKIRMSENATSNTISHTDASQVELTSVHQADNGEIEVRGQLRNVSPFRDFSYYVTVQTSGGLYADWHLPCVESLSTQTLSAKTISKLMPGAPGDVGRQVWVEVVSALPSSEEAAQWRRGEYPQPAWDQ